MEQKNFKKIVNFFLEKGFLICPDMLKKYDENKINSILETSDIDNLILKKTSAILSRKEITSLFNFSKYDENKIEFSNKQEKDTNFEILLNYQEKTSKQNVKEFVDYFRRRFNSMLEILKTHNELQNLTSISRIKNMNINEKKELNTKIVNQLNILLDKLKVDYKGLAEEMDYSDNAYSFRILKGEKVINIYTLVRISQALMSINEKKKKGFDNNIFLPSNILKQINL